MEDLKNLQELIGKEFDTDEIICSMTDLEEAVVVSKVEGHTSNFEGHGECQLYNTYYDMEDTEVYNIWVNSDNIIIHVG